MTIEIFWLTLTAILASALWIPYIVGVNVTKYEGQEAYFERPPEPRNMSAWVHRSHRAHLNLIADSFAILAKAKVKTVEDDMQD